MDCCRGKSIIHSKEGGLRNSRGLWDNSHMVLGKYEESHRNRDCGTTCVLEEADKDLGYINYSKLQESQ